MFAMFPSLIVLVMCLCGLMSAVEGAGFHFFRKANTFPADENGRLKDNWLVYSNNPACHTYATSLWNSMAGAGKDLRLLASVDSPISDLIFGEESKEKCLMGLLDRGTRTTLLHHVLPEKLWDAGEMNLEDTDTSTWLIDWGLRLEVGFISYLRKPLIVNWISESNGARHEVGRLQFGEKHTLWQHTTLGHKFEVVDGSSGDTLATVTAMYDGMVAIGGRGGSRINRAVNFTEGIGQTLNHEIYRAHAVTRTFTEFGFSKSKLPLDIWSSMDAYYHNNRNMYTREEWEDKGYYVNWWERDAYIIHMPWELKVRLQ
jgi:hypothetical protein